MPTAVIISNMGGPHSLDAVECYLYNIFIDPDIIDIPFPEFFRKRFVAWLAKKRAPESREIYEKIGGKTPLTEITEKQALLLEEELKTAGQRDIKVFPAMRYWYPFIEEVWEKVVSESFDKLVICTMYPFYSTTTTGSMENLIQKLNHKKIFSDDKLNIIDRFGSDPTFIDAIVSQIQAAFEERGKTNKDEIHLLLSAHSIPMKRIRNGDPYRDEIEAAVKLIKNALPEKVTVYHSYQSKLGPIKWLSPATPDMIDDLANKGITELFVYPFGFVADNSETLFEIGMLYGDQAKAAGIKKFHRIDALNTHPKFIHMLSDLILQKMEISGEKK
jgi:ferrochelatase